MCGGLIPQTYRATVASQLSHDTPLPLKKPKGSLACAGRLLMPRGKGPPLPLRRAPNRGERKRQRSTLGPLLDCQLHSWTVVRYNLHVP